MGLWGPVLRSPPHGRRGAPAAHPAWYAERPRGRHVNPGQHAARCPAPHSPHRAAAPGPGEYRAGCRDARCGCLAERPGRQGAARPGNRARRDLAVLSGLSLACVLRRPMRLPRYPSASLGRPGRVQRLCARLQTGASVGALPALLGRGEFRDGGVPPGAGPLGVGRCTHPKASP